MNTDHCAGCGVSGVFITVHPTAIWLELLEDLLVSDKKERKGEKRVMAGNREGESILSHTAQIRKLENENRATKTAEIVCAKFALCN